ncbi:restriction endonuclease subunit S [Aeromonas salmonicida]|uniref:restriction endonuclease subunit S n=1 Tax=Aeromonas salmonicida TaxID=645 RepID=UPI003CFE1488
MAMQCIPVEWSVINAADSFDTISTANKKIKSSECKDTGLYPVIDQGQKYINGYIDDDSNIIIVNNPLVVFGDHTKVIKWVDFNFVPGADGTKILNPKAFIYPTFFYHQLKNLDIPDKGYSRHFKFFKELDFVLPSAAEQKEIADRLDKLLAQVEATQVRLASIPDILKRFRQSVLTAAVNGKLTEEWRKISGSTKKTSRTEILNVRRLVWEKFEFKRLADNGKSPVNDKWKQKYKKPNEVLSDNVFDIPESWAWSNLSELSWSVKDGPHYSPKYTESGVPFISGGNVSPSGIDFSNCKYISHELHEELSKRCKPDIGDILYTKGGTTGIAFFNTEERNFNVWVHVAVLKITPITNGFYLQHALNSQHCYGQSQNYTHGVGNQDLGLTRMVNITIPVPPIDEQTEIVRRVEQLFAYADTIEQQAKAAKVRVDNLTRAILAKAFRGELTADWRAANPDLINGDNSAAALLARIQAERTAAKPRKRATKPAISPTSSGVTQ